MSGVDSQLFSIQTLIMAFITTSVMTMFSYAMGMIRNGKFFEPALINELILRLKRKWFGALVPTAGWFSHYFIGLLFIISYQLYWQESDSFPTISKCIILGASADSSEYIDGNWHFVFIRAHQTSTLKNLFATLFCPCCLWCRSVHCGERVLTGLQHLKLDMSEPNVRARYIFETGTI